MKLRTLLIVVAVLAALSAAVFIAHRPESSSSADARLGQPLADAATLEKAAKLRISDHGKTVSLARQSDGSWRVTSFFDLPADFSKISGLVGSLTDAKLQRLVTTNAERIDRLDFKDTQVALLDSADKELWSVMLGKNADGGGRFVRYGTEQKAYLANFNGGLDPESKNWADTELLNLKPDDIAKVEIPFAEGGPVAVSRAKKEDAWTADKTPAGQKVKDDKISVVLNSVSSVRFSDTADPNDASVAIAKANERVFKLTTFEGKTYTVALGRKPEEKKLKPPAATPGPALPGPIAGPMNKDNAANDGEAKSIEDKKPEETKPPAPEYETIPAGPVFVFIASADSAAQVNTLMQKRAFQISDYTFTGLPQKSDELFEPAPSLAPAKPAGEKTEEPKKS